MGGVSVRVSVRVSPDLEEHIGIRDHVDRVRVRVRARVRVRVSVSATISVRVRVKVRVRVRVRVSPDLEEHIGIRDHVDDQALGRYPEETVAIGVAHWWWVGGHHSLVRVSRRSKME